MIANYPPKNKKQPATILIQSPLWNKIPDSFMEVEFWSTDSNSQPHSSKKYRKKMWKYSN